MKTFGLGALALLTACSSNGATFVYTTPPAPTATTPPPAGVDAGPGWSPGSGWLAFDSDGEGTRGIYLVRADGTGLVRLTTSTAAEMEPAFSPDGKKLAYTTNASGQFQVHILDLAAQTSSQLTTRPYGARQPAWSPDGRFVAFAGLPPPTDFDGGNASDGADTGVTAPPVVPDGTADLFVIKPDGTGEQDIVRPAQGGGTPGAYPWGYPLYPTFGTDPSTLVFQGDENIRAIGLDGTGLRQLAGCITESTETPSVSPDGQHLAFSRDGALYTTSFAVHANCADGNDVVAKSSVLNGSYRRPAWGPTGIIAFEAGVTLFHIALVPVTGGAPILLTTWAADDHNPAWAPVGFTH